MIPGKRTGCYQKTRIDDRKEEDPEVIVVEPRFENVGPREVEVTRTKPCEALAGEM